MHAFRAAWEDRHHWPLAFFASILFAAGSYDILFQNVGIITIQSSILDSSLRGASFSTDVAQAFWASGTGDLIDFLVGLQGALVFVALFVAIAALSCVCQAALVYALGSRRRSSSKPTLREALRIGGGLFWPVAALNVLTISLLWIMRFFISLPLVMAMQQPSAFTYALYLFFFIFFIGSSFILSIIHVFALNAIVLQGATIGNAVLRAYRAWKTHWIVCIETATLLFITALVVGAAALTACYLLAIPLLALVLLALSAHSYSLFILTLIIGVSFFIACTIILVAFLTQAQYATWTFLFWRIGEGGLLPKLHRLIRSLTGFSAPRGR